MTQAIFTSITVSFSYFFFGQPTLPTHFFVRRSPSSQGEKKPSLFLPPFQVFPSHQLERRDRTLKEGRGGPPSPPPLSPCKSIHFLLTLEKGKRGSQRREQRKGKLFVSAILPLGRKVEKAPPSKHSAKKGQREKGDRPSFASHHFCSSLFYVPGPSVLTHLLPGLPEHLPPAGVTGHHLSAVWTAVDTTAERGK